MYLMQPYDDTLQQILNNGVSRTNKRTGIKTLSIFGSLQRYRLDTEFFPVITKRKVYPMSVIGELLWFLSGSTSNDDLKKLGCNFWTPWVNPEFENANNYDAGMLGPVYGFQLRNFGGEYGTGTKDENYGKNGFDQLSWVVNRIKEDHSCRRTLWSLWNPAQLKSMRLPPCHMMAQVLVDDDRNLSLIFYMRSCDFPVGFGSGNSIFYAALAILLAQQTDCKPKELIAMIGDCHIYQDQIPAVQEYLSRQNPPDSPKLKINKAKDIFSYTPADFKLEEYNPMPRIEVPVAV